MFTYVSVQLHRKPDYILSIMYRGKKGKKNQKHIPLLFQSSVCDWGQKLYPTAVATLIAMIIIIIIEI